jgi:uncharacterized membrane protein YhhN
VLAGLVLSLCGDAADPAGRPRIFQAGVAAFGLAHVAYLAAFALRFESVALATLGLVIAALALARVLPGCDPTCPTT